MNYGHYSLSHCLDIFFIDDKIMHRHNVSSLTINMIYRKNINIFYSYVNNF